MAKGKVEQDGQMGLQDEPINDQKAQEAIRTWFRAKMAAEGTRAKLKAVDDSADAARDLLPAVTDGQEHRFTFIDETGAEPVQYVVLTRPGPDDKDIKFVRTSRPRIAVEQHEAPR